MGRLVTDRVKGRTDLHTFSDQGHLEEVRECLLRGDPQLPDDYGSYPVMFAAKKGHIDIVRLLFQYGATHCPGQFEETPAVIAMRHRQPETVLVLFKEYGADHTPSSYGWTPLGLAVLKGSGDVVDYLLNHGATHQPQGLQMTPLELAVNNNIMKQAMQLLEHGADPTWSPAVPGLKSSVEGLVRMLELEG